MLLLSSIASCPGKAGWLGLGLSLCWLLHHLQVTDCCMKSVSLLTITSLACGLHLICNPAKLPMLPGPS